jgi:acyl-coenzyme A synthetase/AMP-(fatty) acid ligase
LFTTGTTGDPKGIIACHRPLSHFLEWHCREFALKRNDRFSMLSGLSHDPLLRDIFTPLWLGATLCIPDPEITMAPDRLKAWMRDQRITVTHITPAMNQILTSGIDEAAQEEERPATLPDLRYVFFGGDELSWRHVERLHRLAPSAECVNFYGTSETPQAMGYFRLSDLTLESLAASDHANDAIVPIGRGIDAVQLMIVNKAGLLAEVGELGEILVRTPYLATGYLNDENLTKSRFVVNPLTKADGDLTYITGDWGRYLPGGDVQFCGRGDRQVSIRGFRVELKEIEVALARHSEIGDCAVVVQEKTAGGRYLSAFLVPRNSQAPDTEDLKAFLDERLPGYMMPSLFIPLEKLPITPNGKINYRQLQHYDHSKKTEDRHYNHELPMTPTESMLASAWKTALEIDYVGRYDNFFSIGGNSLLSLNVIAEIEQKVGVRLNPGEFIYQTLGQIAVVLNNNIKAAGHEKPSGITRKLFSLFKDRT